MNMTYSILGYKLSNRHSNLLLRPKRTEHNFLVRVYPKYQFMNRDTSQEQGWVGVRTGGFEAEAEAMKVI